MAKTANDEEYESGVRDGMNGDFFDDIVQGLVQSGSIYDEGYNYGAEHRFDSKKVETKSIFNSSNEETVSNINYIHEERNEIEYSSDLSSNYDEEDDDDEYFYDDDDEYTPTPQYVSSEPSEEELFKKYIDEVRKRNGPLHIPSNASAEFRKRIVDSGQWALYESIVFDPPTYFVKYKCTLCGHEVDAVIDTYGSPEETINCNMGCSFGNSGPSLWGLYKGLKKLVTGREQFGYCKIIEIRLLS